MNGQFRDSTTVGVLALSISSSTLSPVDTALLGSIPGAPGRLVLAWNAHSVAVVGMVALAVLGGLLVARNRLEESDSLVAEPETRHEEFMTDREKVRQLISDRGGRMKQSEIVDSVDWSKAKVSRLLAELEDDGQITKLRLGRENLVCLPGSEPTASKSPEQPKSE